MIKAVYNNDVESFDKGLLNGVIYDIIIDSKNGSVDIYFEDVYINWCSMAYFEKRFIALADLRNKRIDEILED